MRDLTRKGYHSDCKIDNQEDFAFTAYVVIINIHACRLDLISQRGFPTNLKLPHILSTLLVSAFSIRRLAFHAFAPFPFLPPSDIAANERKLGCA
jgi:hypothetical protein